MKKSIAAILITLSLIFCVSGITAAANEQDGIVGSSNTVMLRIEGAQKLIYSGKLVIPGGMDLKTALMNLDDEDDALTFKGLKDDYLTEINGEATGSYGGWDGWLFTVNGQMSSVPFSAVIPDADGEVVIFYGDPYLAGMQFPVADTSEISKGIIKFTSTDTAYVDNQAVTSVNPVKNATVTLGEDSYTTDDNGEIRLTKAYADGKYTLGIEKKHESGLPAVLRFAPDYSIEIKGLIVPDESSDAESGDLLLSSEVSSDSSDAEIKGDAQSNPKTGDTAVAAAVMMLGLSAAFAVLSGKNRKD